MNIIEGIKINIKRLKIVDIKSFKNKGKISNIAESIPNIKQSKIITKI